MLTSSHGRINSIARAADFIMAAFVTMRDADTVESLDTASDTAIAAAEALVAEYDARPSNKRRRPSAALLAARAMLAGDSTVTNGANAATVALVTDEDLDALDTLTASAMRLARDAGTLARLYARTGDDRAADALDASLVTARVLLARIATVNPEAFIQWQGTVGERALTGLDAAERGNIGSKWNTSLSNGEDFSGPNGGTHIRHTAGVSNNKAHYGAPMFSTVDEAAILAQIEAEDGE